MYKFLILMMDGFIIHLFIYVAQINEIEYIEYITNKINRMINMYNPLKIIKK